NDYGGALDVGMLEAGAAYFVTRLVLVGDEVNVVLVEVETDYGVIHVEELLPRDGRGLQLVERHVVGGRLVFGAVGDYGDEVGRCGRVGDEAEVVVGDL